jgi:hypothetical protein
MSKNFTKPFYSLILIKIKLLSNKRIKKTKRPSDYFTLFNSIYYSIILK